MKANREALEDQLEAYEQKLAGFKSFVSELNDRAAEHGTDRSLFEEDLFEAQHNAEHYEAEIARIRQELKGLSADAEPGRTGTGTVLPQTAKQGLGVLLISAVGLLAGALIGSRMSARKGSAAGKGEK